ncbi:hypothetical protein ACFQ1T_10410 [Methylophilus glucosoxydans]|jgi:hypothetical protein|uniref:Uncharacterized protein n=1 Tax=Methylophilus glucosoxydans TaxID=752553 RepID=A0ABW3GHT8_9PROT|nr:hypothetical protein [Methylophilus sp. 13]MBF5037875.1 hypothetical protein [Methylophilus sp. 13]
MKIIILLLLLVSFETSASEDFSIEEHFTKPVKIPAPISTYLNKEMREDIALCEGVKPEDMFEVKTIHLNKSSKTYLVKPASTCLCGVYYCPMWIFQMKHNTAHLIWDVSGTGFLEVLNKKTNGFKQLKELGGAAMHGHMSIWSWDGKKYIEIHRQLYSRNNAKNCFDIETFHLKNGKLIRATNKCLDELP